MRQQKKQSLTVEQLGLDDQIAKRSCELSQLYFTRYFFKRRFNSNFRVNWHHKYLAEKLEQVMRGEIKNLVINVSPGSSKTEMIVINFIARSLAINPWCRFLHLSYSDDLALLNSQTARDIIQSDEYQKLWPIPIADDDKAKKRWNVMFDGKKAGGTYAVALGGQVTGFRAGQMRDGFHGAMLIDDPLKPEDAFSEQKIKVANRRLLSTVKSRLANPLVPIILIMQRISEKDPTAFIKAGHLGPDWEHVVIPSIIDDAYVAQLPERYRPMVERDDTERFSYWKYKEPIEALLAMERGEGSDQEGSRMSRHVFSSQWMQNPTAIGGNVIQGAWFPRFKVIPKIKYRKIYADTAQKTKERNDRSVFECWGYGEDGKIYLLDLLKGKWEGQDLELRAKEFWNKHKAAENLEWIQNYKPDMIGQLRQMMVEDKSSGTGLIQKIRFINAFPIQGIERATDKLTRVMDVQGYLSQGMACVPEDAPFTLDFIAECEAFTKDDSHAYDDQIDPLVDAVNDLLGLSNKLETWKRLKHVEEPHAHGTVSQRPNVVQDRIARLRARYSPNSS